MIPANMTEEAFATFLQAVVHEVVRSASHEGSIRWSLAEDGEGFVVQAAVRNNNDQGQGGMWLVQDEVVDQPPTPEQVARSRAVDIRARMQADMRNTMAAQAGGYSGEILDALADDAMFHVEHLLSQIATMEEQP